MLPSESTLGKSRQQQQQQQTPLACRTQTMASNARINVTDNDQYNNDLFERLPFLADALLAQLDAAAVLQLSCTCKAWRKAVQLCQLSLSPKSELAMPFVAGCLHLRRLQLSHMQPAQGSQSCSLLSHLAHLTSLTHLALARSLTAAWRGQAVELSPEDLAHLAGCTALQVLDLAHQPCLQDPASLSHLAHMPCLTALHLSISDTNWVSAHESWQALAAMTGLQTLDLSGWSRCRVQAVPAAAAAAAEKCWQEGQQQQHVVRERRSSDSSSNSSGSGSSGSGSRIGRALGRLLHAQHRGAVSVGLTGSILTAATLPIVPTTSTVPVAAAAAALEPGVPTVGSASAVQFVECPAPLALLGCLSCLHHLVLADWSEPPSAAGLAALCCLPHLAYLDISRCMMQAANNSSSTAASRQQVSLMQLLTGATRQQQQQQQCQLCADCTADALPAPVPPPPAAAGAVGAAVPAAFFSNLLCLKCTGVDFLFEPSVWGALSHLSHLNVAACSKCKGEGLSQLTALEELVASDCVQLDYDAMKDLLTSARKLQHLDLQRSVVILHGSGQTAAALSSGRYLQPQPRHQQGQVTGSSRRDAADFSGAEQGSAASTAAAAATAIAASSQQHGLRALLMNEVQLAVEGFVWPQQEPGGQVLPVLDHPCLLLYHLVSSAAMGLQDLQVLRWNHAALNLASAILSQLVPLACKSLTELRLSGCGLPEDPSRCWQGLAAATNLRILDLNHTGFSRQGYAKPCGTNPTVALLTAVARMRLEVLWLAGWRFYFADLKPLAGLSECLRSLDLTRGRDVTDNTLWSLTHLTSLTWLSVSGARISNDQIFSLILLHLSNLRHLDLSGISKFTTHSLPALLQLRSLASLDIRSTSATADSAAISLLVKLPHCRRLAVSVGADDSYSRPQLLSEVYSRGTPRSSLDGVSAAAAAERLQGYAYLRELGKAQSLRQLLLGGSTPALTEYCRSLLPPWVDVR